MKLGQEDRYFIFDFDTTFVKVEALEELAKIALKQNPEKDKIIAQIEALTKDGMEGKIPFNQSLSQRLLLFHANKDHLQKLTRLLKRRITSSILRNKKFFKKYQNKIYIISGGFKEFIAPVVASFGIGSDHVLANTFKFNSKGEIIGYDKKNPLSQDQGKIKKIKEFGFKGKIYVIGDGHTDYQIKESGVAQKFFAFIENTKRGTVVKKADRVLPNLDEFLYLFRLPASVSYPKNRIKVLLLENIHQKAVDLLVGEGFQVESFSHALSEKELVKKIQEVSVLGIRSKTVVTAHVLKQANKLLAVGAFCIGTNQIDLKSSLACGVPVFNAPYSNSRSVVEMILGEIIVLYRRLFEKNLKLHRGQWDKTSVGCHELRGKNLGIVGYGNIGSQLSVLAENLGMNVCFYDTAEKLSLGNAQKCESLSDLLKKADVVTVHVDGRKSNKNLIGEREFKKMKPGAIFLNASRGFVVDLKALAKFIKNGKIAGAAIDVFPEEPKSSGDKFYTSIQGLDNVILTPHIGGNTEEAQQNIGQFVAAKIINFINKGDTTLSVNFPNLQLPELKKTSRLIHIHQNHPGILAKINNVLAEEKINIEGQYLKTNDDIGCVITDVNKKCEKTVTQRLKEIPGTIKLRVLY